MSTAGAELRAWSARRWAVAVLVGVAGTVAVAVPTDLIDTPWFTRDVPPTWWAWPALAVSAALAGMLAATYVADPDDQPTRHDPGAQEPHGGRRAARGGGAAGVLTFFAVGCPVCNKLALLALGYAGALTWFQPFQPVLQAIAVGLLWWALRARLTNATACRIPAGGRARAPEH